MYNKWGFNTHDGVRAMKTLNRRHFLTGAGILLAAPAIVKASSIMSVKPVLDIHDANWWTPWFEKDPYPKILRPFMSPEDIFEARLARGESIIGESHVFNRTINIGEEFPASLVMNSTFKFPTRPKTGFLIKNPGNMFYACTFEGGGLQFT